MRNDIYSMSFISEETDKFISKLVEEKIVEEKQKNQKIEKVVIL